MLQINSIFNIHPLGWNSPEGFYRGVVRNSKNTNLPLGAPVLINKDSYDEAVASVTSDNGSLMPGYSQRKSIRVFSLVDLGTEHTEEIRLNQLSPVLQEAFTVKHRILEVDSFDISKLPRLIKHVQTIGSVSLVMSGLDNVNLFVKQLQEFSKIFKLRGVLSSLRSNNSVNYPNFPSMRLVVSLFDVSHGFPIFNPKKKDGIIMQVTLLDEQRSLGVGAPVNIYTSTYVYSNFEENIINIDSQGFRTISSSISDTLSKLRGYADEWYSGYKTWQKENKLAAPEGVPMKPPAMVSPVGLTALDAASKVYRSSLLAEAVSLEDTLKEDIKDIKDIYESMTPNASSLVIGVHSGTQYNTYRELSKAPDYGDYDFDTYRKIDTPPPAAPKEILVESIPYPPKDDGVVGLAEEPPKKSKTAGKKLQKMLRAGTGKPRY